MYDRIEKSRWKTFFDRMSKNAEGKSVELEVISLELGDQLESDGLTLNGITYDASEDALYVTMQGRKQSHLEHVIRSPQDIYVDVGTLGIAEVVVVEAEGRKQFVKLREPMALPADNRP